MKPWSWRWTRPPAPPVEDADGGGDAAAALIFAPGPGRRGARGALAAMLGLSVLGHAASFYALQVFYAPAVALPPSPPPVRWTILPEGSPENAALSRWLTVADPALASGTTTMMTGAGPSPAGRSMVPYVPSFATDVSAERDAGPLTPAAPPGSGEPSARQLFPPGPAPTPPLAAPDATRREVTPPPSKTRLIFSESLRDRLPPVETLPTVRLAATDARGGVPTTLAELLRPARFLVGVPAEGGAPLIFREESAGVTAADEAARAYLQALPFRPAPAAGGPGPASIAWGRVTFLWGGEVYR